MGARPEPAWRGRAAQRSSLACCRICPISSAVLALGAAEDALSLPTVRHPGPVASRCWVQVSGQSQGRYILHCMAWLGFACYSWAAPQVLLAYIPDASVLAAGACSINGGVYKGSGVCISTWSDQAQLRHG